MSRYRNGAGGKRDENEPNIIEALRAHGCVVWQLSGKGIPDLLVFCSDARNLTGAGTVRRTFVADVKGPKEKPTPAQVERWTALTNLGFAVFILRTPEDAVAMLNNALQPWEPERKDPPVVVRTRLGPTVRKTAPHYTPPRSKPVDAAKEAEVFAPPPYHKMSCESFNGNKCDCGGST